MKQLHYTSCRPGKSLRGSSGFQIRAITPGIDPDQLYAAITYAGYALPPGIHPNDATAACAPVRLALLETPELGRILCHSVYVGQDPTTGRHGNFFSHLLLNVGEDLGAAAAIQTWGSEFWQRVDNDEGTTLPEISEFPISYELRPALLVDFVADTSHAELVEFLLRALLSTEPECRIIVAAPTFDIVLAIYALTQSLPIGLLNDLTFSTYESEPLSCRARVIGTCWSKDSARDLPASCYSGRCLGFNTYTGKQSPLPSDILFSRYAAKALGASYEELTRFCEGCAQLGVADGGLLDAVYRLSRPRGVHELENHHIIRLLEKSEVADWCLAKSPAAASLVTGILSHPDREKMFYYTVISLVGKALCRSAQPLEHLRNLGLDLQGQGVIEGWACIERYCDSTSVALNDVTHAANALAMQPPVSREQFLDRIIPTLADSLHAAAQHGDIAEALRHVLLSFGPCATGGVWEVFQRLLSQFEHGSSRCWRNVKLSYAFAAIICSADIGRHLKREQVYQVVRQIKSRGGSEVLKAVTYRTRRWPRGQRRRWRRLTFSFTHLMLSVLLGLLVLFCLFVAIDELWLKQFRFLELLPVGRQTQNGTTKVSR